MFQGKTILITGGTGSIGKCCALELLTKHDPAKIIILSRDEMKQSEMAIHPDFNDNTKLRFFLADVRDKDRLERAMADVDYVIHTAALTQVSASEYNSHEFIKTNINGAMNVVDAAIATGVKKVIALSSDDAVNSVHLYGATKLCADKVFIAANNYSGQNGTRFSVARLGSIIDSQSSFIPLFLKQKNRGLLTLTCPETTRFVTLLSQAATFALRCLNTMTGGEVFIPKQPSCSLVQLAEAIAPGCEIKNRSEGPHEKKHATLIPADEANQTTEQKDCFIIHPSQPHWGYQGREKHKGANCSSSFSYSSEGNPDQLTVEGIKNYIAAASTILHRE